MRNFEAALSNYVRLEQERSDGYFKTNYPMLTGPLFEIDRGSKFVRIVKSDRGLGAVGRSVHVFIEIETGLILKAASWKQPTKKNPRGSIYDANPLAGTTVHGAVYLK